MHRRAVQRTAMRRLTIARSSACRKRNEDFRWLHSTLLPQHEHEGAIAHSGSGPPPAPPRLPGDPAAECDAVPRARALAVFWGGDLNYRLPLPVPRVLFALGRGRGQGKGRGRGRGRGRFRSRKEQV